MKKPKTQTLLLGAAAALCLAGTGLLLASPQEPLTAGVTVTNATGTISQLEYDTTGEVSGFLLGTTTLLEFPTEVMGGIGTLGAAGNGVTYSGSAVTTSSGFQTVRVSTFTNTTTKATYTSTTPKSTAYGPTSGTVKQLNYDDTGAIDGFVFTPGGSTASVFVVTGTRASATLKPLLTVGATVSVTGSMSTIQASVCAATGSLAAVEATSLATGGQTIVITGGAGPGRGYGKGRG